MSVDQDVLKLPFTEADFIADFRSNGFLAGCLEAAIPAYVAQHQLWFEHAEQLNAAGQAAYINRENEIVGLSTHSSKAIAIRAMLRAAGAYQAALILLRRGMAAEADTLVRGLYEIAFWLGFLVHDERAAVRALLVDELQSQNSTYRYYLELGREGRLNASPKDLADIEDKLAANKVQLNGERSLDPKSLALKADLFEHYDAYKNISAGSVHISFHSLHRHLKLSAPGIYDGHVMGPDVEATGPSLQRACTAFGLVTAHFATIIGPADGDLRLDELLRATDRLRTPQS